MFIQVYLIYHDLSMCNRIFAPHFNFVQLHLMTYFYSVPCAFCSMTFDCGALGCGKRDVNTMPYYHF